MAQNQEYDAHHESMKMSFLEQGVNIFWEEHLSLDFPSQIVGDDPVIIEPDAVKLKDPRGRQAAQDEDKKKTIDEPDLE